MTHLKSGLWNKWWLASILVLVLAVLAAGCTRVNENTVLVTRVIDGDTIEIEGGYRVRYIGIDTPEKGEPYYWEALKANQELVEGKRIRLEGEVEDKDKYGRLLRYIWVDGTMVNAELVRQGYAYSYSYPPNLKYQAHFLQMEREAREQGLGLWSRSS
ncbi:MAG: thermonuclease family protein [Chloroflexota bacterium]|nr:thermonuclease family protein [Chloroflexota bacterium]